MATNFKPLAPIAQSETLTSNRGKVKSGKLNKGMIDTRTVGKPTEKDNSIQPEDNTITIDDPRFA